MSDNRSFQRKPTKAARKARAAIIRRSRVEKNIISVDYGTVKRLDGRTSTIEFRSKPNGVKEKTLFRDFHTWRLAVIKADFCGARVKHETFWLGRDMPDMAASRLTRVGPTISLKMTGPQRRLTAEDYALLDRDSPAENDEK